jgi:hypothetical protein
MVGTEVLMNQKRILHWMLSYSSRRASKSSTWMTASATESPSKLSKSVTSLGTGFGMSLVT